VGVVRRGGLTAASAPTRPTRRRRRGCPAGCWGRRGRRRNAARTCGRSCYRSCPRPRNDCGRLEHPRTAAEECGPSSPIDCLLPLIRPPQYSHSTGRCCCFGPTHCTAVEQANSSLLFITGGSREKWPRAGLQAALLRWRADRVHFEAQDW
jgi:hypothetical protein